MNTSLIVLVIAVAAGLLVGILGRPLSWRLFGGVLGLGLTFFVFELGHALLRGTPFADLAYLLDLSYGPAFQHYVGAIMIAYAAFVAAIVIAIRIILARRRAPDEA